MTDIVETAARAMVNRNNGGGPDQFDSLTAEERQTNLDMARAALGVVLNPPDDVLLGAWKNIPDAVKHAIWDTMMKACLHADRA